jgi:hypothetical protein
MIAPIHTVPASLYPADVRQVDNQAAAFPSPISLAQKKPQKKKIVPVPRRDPAPYPAPSGVGAPPPPPPTSEPIPNNPPPAPPSTNSSSKQNSAANYIGPAVSFGNSSQIGAVSRFGVGTNISVRPSIFLGNSPQFTLPITYDFPITSNDQFGENPLIMMHAGGGISYQSVTGGNSLKPLALVGADAYLGGGASLLLQVSSTFNSDFAGIVGVGLQF